MKDIAIYGAGGFGREVACLIERINKARETPIWNFIVFFDDGIPSTNDYPQGPVLGDINVLNTWKTSLSITVAIGSPKTLKSIVDNITNKKIDYPNIVDPSAVLYEIPQIGIGNIITANCVFTTNIKLGSYNIFNIGTIIPHDVIIGDFNVFNPYVNVSGNTFIGNRNLFGVKCTIIQGKTIGDNNNIGAGSVVLDSIDSCKSLLGNPAINSILILKEYFRIVKKEKQAK